MNSDEELIAMLPLRQTWLDDIVDILLHRPNGTAEIVAITSEIMRVREVGSEPEATITRTINNYCSDANDINRVVRYDLFERVSPGTYRLRGFPEKPDSVDIQSVEFTDAAYASTWDWFCKIMQRNPKWPVLKKRQRLVAFSRSIQPGGRFREELQRRIEWHRDIEQLSIELLI